MNVIFNAASFGTCVNVFFVYIFAGAPFTFQYSTSYFTAFFDALFAVDIMICNWQMTLYTLQTLGVERVNN